MGGRPSSSKMSPKGCLGPGLKQCGVRTTGIGITRKEACWKCTFLGHLRLLNQSLQDWDPGDADAVLEKQCPRGRAPGGLPSNGEKGNAFLALTACQACSQMHHRTQHTACSRLPGWDDHCPGFQTRKLREVGGERARQPGTGPRANGLTCPKPLKTPDPVPTATSASSLRGQ